MAITKRFLKTKPECKVTFTLEAEKSGGAQTAALVGDFNAWDPTAMPMKRRDDGSFTLTCNLPTGSVYKFRYLLDDDCWVNDPEADAYEFCGFAGGDNSLLHL